MLNYSSNMLGIIVKSNENNNFNKLNVEQQIGKIISYFENSEKFKK